MFLILPAWLADRARYALRIERYRDIAALFIGYFYDADIY